MISKTSLALLVGTGCAMGATNAQLGMADEPAFPVIPDSAAVVPLPYGNRLCGEEAVLALGRNFYAIGCGNYIFTHKKQGESCIEELWYQSPNDNYVDVMRDTNCDGIAEEFLVTDHEGNNLHPADPNIVHEEYQVRTHDMDKPAAEAVWREWLADQH